MEGDFEFVEGTLQNPVGEPFAALCPRFLLAHPDYVY
jgi:hypothetical protein